MKEGDYSAVLDMCDIFKETESSSSESSEESVAGVERATRKCYDGREVTLVSTSTQTELEMKDLEEFAKKTLIIPLHEAQAEAPAVAAQFAARIPGLITQSPRGNASVGSHDMSITQDQAHGFPFQEVPGDEYGIPALDVSSDTDTSDEDEPSKPVPSPDAEAPVLIDNVGPPQILKYQRESDWQERRLSQMNEEAGMLFADNEEIMTSILSGMFLGSCEFCGEAVKPFPSIEEQQTMEPDELFCCEQYQQFVEYILQQQQVATEDTPDELIDIKVHAHYGTQTKARSKQKTQKLRERELKKEQHHQQMQQQIHQVQQHGMNFYASSTTGRANDAADSTAVKNVVTGSNKSLSSKTTADGGSGTITSSRHSQSKASIPAAVGASNEQTPNVSKYKEMMPPGGGAASVPRPAMHNMNADGVARQMKTINYQLSSQKCLEEGWTVRKPTPLVECDDEEETFIAEPTFRTFTQGPNMTERYYENGTKFMTIFPDSSGNVFYPSGNIAILITPVTKRQFSFMVMDDIENSLVMASFDPTGYSFCYHKNGGIRLNIDPLGGIELDTHGSKRRRWHWQDQQNIAIHTHAPPFQPLCFGLNRYISMRMMSQQNMTLTFSAKSHSCRFSVGAKLTLLAPENIPLPEVDESQIFLADRHCYVDSLLDKVTTLLRFPKSPKVDKILPPLHLTSKLEKTEKMRKEKVRTAEANKGKRLLPVVVVQ